MLIKNTIASAILGAAISGAALAQGAPGSDSVPRAVYITAQDTEFRKTDADKNGQLTRAEVEAFDRATQVAQARAKAVALFTQLDTDKNGQISPIEFGKLASQLPPVDGRPLIARLDINKDGQISVIEYRAGKLANFDRIDADKDGVVSTAELKAAGVK